MNRTWEEIRAGVDLCAAGSKAIPHQTAISRTRAHQAKEVLGLNFEELCTICAHARLKAHSSAQLHPFTLF